MNRPGHRGRRWARGVVFLLAALVLIGVGLWGLLHVPSVRAALLRKLSAQLSRGGARVELSGLSGTLPGHWTLARVTIGDEQGDWLEIERLSMRLAPAALWRGFVRIEDVTVDSVHVLRRPVSPPTQEASRSPGRVPGWLRGVELERLFVQELRLDEDVAGVSSSWRAGGDFAFVPSRRLEILAQVSRTDGPPGRLDLQYRRVEGATPSFNFHVTAHEDVDGILTARLPPPLRGPWNFWLTGLGAVPDWHAGWALRVGNQIRFEGDAQGVLETNSLGGRIESMAQYRNRVYEAVLDFKRTGSEVEFRSWSLQAGDARAEGSGFLDYQARRGNVKMTAQLADGRLEGVLRVDSTLLEGDVDFADLSIARLQPAQPWVAGKAAGHLQLGGTLAEPKAEFHAQLKQVRVVADPRTPSLEIRLDGGFQNHRLQTSMQVDGLADRPMQADASIPLHLSLAPWSLRLLPEEWGSGRLEAEVNLADLARLVAPIDQIVEGELAIRATCAGSMSRPEVRGLLQVDQGRYENLKYGLILQQLFLRLESDHSELVLREARATDGSDGSLALTGRLRLSPTEGFPFQLECLLNQATLVRHPLLLASFDGRVGLAGTLRQMRLEGSLTLPRAEARIPGTLSSAAEFPNVVEINQPPSPKPSPARRPSFDLPGRVALNLKVSAADRLFVRGRGLESEWRGALTLKGTLSQPSLVGSLSTVRGRFMLLGRRFVLGNSVITLGGASPPDPLLNISAQAQAAGITATLAVTGPLSAPSFTLQSVPPLPEEEILSRILFGRSSDRISPWQALRLAQGVRLLQGGSDTFDILGRGQQWLGVDVLDVRTEGSSGASPVVTVGKYFGDRVYVEGGAGIGAGEVRMSVDLTPSLTLETETSPRIRDEIGLRWHLDY